jgi:Fic family protein
MLKTHSLQITPELLRLIAEVDEFKGSWNSIHTLTPERLSALRHVAAIESIGSSTRIEGVTLTDKEVEILLGRLGTESFKSRDEQEVAGYAEVMETIFQNYQLIPLTENYLMQLHGMLLRHSHKDERHRGQYKTLNNHVEAFDSTGKSLGVIFQTATPFETPKRMDELLRWTSSVLEDKSLHPLLVVGIFTVVFLAIHPFQDGNGRLSRILTALLLLKAGYAYLPYSSLESVIERNKEAYYLALRRTQTSLEQESPDWLPWLSFFLRALKTQKDHLQVKMDETQGWEGLPSDSVKILNYLLTHERINIQDAEQLTQTPRATLKLRLNQLIESGLIIRHGKARGTWYALKH